MMALGGQVRVPSFEESGAPGAEPGAAVAVEVAGRCSAEELS